MDSVVYGQCSNSDITPAVKEITSLYKAASNLGDLLCSKVVEETDKTRKRGKVAACVAFALDKIKAIHSLPEKSKQDAVDKCISRCKTKGVMLPAGVLKHLEKWPKACSSTAAAADT